MNLQTVTAFLALAQQAPQDTEFLAFIWRSLPLQPSRFRLEFMKAAHLFSAALTLCLSTSAVAQDYPYDDANQESDSAASLPVEVPNSSSPTQRVPKKALSLFRMGLKVGANFTSFQDRLCVAADNLGCASYLNRSFTGVGFEGRVSFGWDLAYQPVFIETEVGFSQKLANLEAPLKVIQVQQGLFHRERIGKNSLWKNGVLAVVDLRVFKNSDSQTSAATVPAIGFATLIEWGSFITQANFYLHQLRSNENHFSSSLLVGTRF